MQKLGVEASIGYTSGSSNLSPLTPMPLPTYKHQILATHAEFIRQVVSFSQNEVRQPELQKILQSARENGWPALVDALQQIIEGQRDLSLIQGMDEEDRVIAEAVMQGLQNPSTLPELSQHPNPTLAGPGLAHMIHAAASDPRALILISQMAEQMQTAGGDMARISGVIRPLINGERNEKKLTRNMGEQGRQLVKDILEALEGMST